MNKKDGARVKAELGRAIKDPHIPLRISARNRTQSDGQRGIARAPAHELMEASICNKLFVGAGSRARSAVDEEKSDVVRCGLARVLNGDIESVKRGNVGETEHALRGQPR